MTLICCTWYSSNFIGDFIQAVFSALLETLDAFHSTKKKKPVEFRKTTTFSGIPKNSRQAKVPENFPLEYAELRLNDSHFENHQFFCFSRNFLKRCLQPYPPFEKVAEFLVEHPYVSLQISRQNLKFDKKKHFSRELKCQKGCLLSLTYFQHFGDAQEKQEIVLGEAHPYTLCFRGLSDVLRMIDGLILTEDLLRKRFRNFAPHSKLHFYSSDYLLHQSVSRRKLFENALFKPEAFGNAGFALKCGQKTFCKRSFSHDNI